MPLDSRARFVLSCAMAGGDNLDSDWLPGSNDPKVTDEQIFDQLVASDGNLSHSAKALGISRSRLKARVDKNVVLASLLNEMRDEIIDLAEGNVFTDVRKNDATANRFVLQTIGKDRGYSSGVAGSGKGGEIVIQINRLSEDSTDGS